MNFTCFADDWSVTSSADTRTCQAACFTSTLLLPTVLSNVGTVDVQSTGNKLQDAELLQRKDMRQSYSGKGHSMSHPQCPSQCIDNGLCFYVLKGFLLVKDLQFTPKERKCIGSSWQILEQLSYILKEATELR